MGKVMNRAIINFLKKTYFDLNSPAAYASINKVIKIAKKKFPSLTREDVKEFLEGESTFTLYRPNR